MDTAVVTADAPGIGTIFILLFIHSFTKIFPGSDIVGVPASEIIETILLFLSSAKIFRILFFSLNLRLVYNL